MARPETNQPPRRTGRDNGTREDILATAVRTFSSKGYANVSLQEIAADMGITKAAIYYYFRRKEEILGEALERAGATLMERVREETGRQGDAEEKLHAVIRAHVSHVLAHRQLYSVYFSDISQLDPKRREKILDEERWYARTVTALIESGIADGRFREVNARTMTLSILGMLNSTIRWFQPAHGLSHDALAASLAEFAVAGLKADATG
jgi:AcrR family transcriptional regulator